MAEITLHVLKPSVNNLTARVFVRAAELDLKRWMLGERRPRQSFWR